MSATSVKSLVFEPICTTVAGVNGNFRHDSPGHILARQFPALFDADDPVESAARCDCEGRVEAGANFASDDGTGLRACHIWTDERDCSCNSNGLETHAR